MPTRETTSRTAMAIASVIFFMWGFLTSLNDVLVPHLKSVFALDYFHVMLVQFTFFGAYFVMSLPSGQVVSRLGHKHSIVLGLLVAGAGALLFYPAAAAPSFAIFLTAFFTLASGITLLQVAANPYVSLLGPERTASSRLNLAQALNSLGTTLAPKLGGLLILSGAVLTSAEIARMPLAGQAAYRAHQAALVQGPYLGLAAVLFLVAAGVYLFHLPALSSDARRADAAGGRTFAAALGRRHLRSASPRSSCTSAPRCRSAASSSTTSRSPRIGAMPEARAGGVRLAVLGRSDGRPLPRRRGPSARRIRDGCSACRPASRRRSWRRRSARAG